MFSGYIYIMLDIRIFIYEVKFAYVSKYKVDPGIEMRLCESSGEL